MKELFGLGSISESVASIIKKYGPIYRDNLLKRLLWLQKNQLLPISPFSIDDSGNIKSDVIELVINNLKGLGYVIEDEKGLLVLTGKGKTIFKRLVEVFPPKMGACDIHLPLRKFYVKIGNKNFRVKLNAKKESINFSTVLPPCPELGVIFSMPLEIILNNFLPLEITSNQVVAYVIQKSSEEALQRYPSIIQIRDMRKKIHHYLHQLHSGYSKENAELILRILLYSLLPYSSIQSILFCGEHHETKTPKGPTDVFTVPIPTSCPECHKPIKERYIVLENPKIAIDWANGAFMDWFIAEIIQSVGIPRSYWFCEVEGEECDVLGLGEDMIVVIECKRIEKRGTEYERGKKQLRDLKQFFRSTGMNVLTALVTTISEPPKYEEGIDLIITRTNFANMKNELKVLLD